MLNNIILRLLGILNIVIDGQTTQCEAKVGCLLSVIVGLVLVLCKLCAGVVNISVRRRMCMFW